MKHYKIFGESLRQGCVKISYSDIVVELLGILIHTLSLSPQAAEVLQIMSQMHQTHGANATLPPPLAVLAQLANSTDSCAFNSSDPFIHTGTIKNECMFSMSLGSAGVIIHIVELLAMFIVLKMGRQTDPAKLELWITLTGVLTVLDVLVFVGSVVLKADAKLIAYSLSNLIYKMYSCGLIKAYSDEQKTSGENTSINKATCSGSSVQD